ncbi:hemerythrin domain-containing protein [Thiocystis violacea]|uniref:hemerythrin domain-containing protein n=1 Tax=Thiocystis violacea TaxID=13725 RepID=UPI001F5B29F3|nr:hemerythrin domain-containing protein [Thiocystis violacea]
MTQVKEPPRGDSQNPAIPIHQASDTSMASIITDAFTQDHHACDHRLAAAEACVGRGDWSDIGTAAEALVSAMNRHFDAEEQTLFPRLAEIYRVAANPIEVMLSEHAQMRVLFEDLTEAVGRQDRDTCLGILETLHFLTQQHNSKEECVLYPMADGALKTQAGEIADLLAHG